MQPTAQHLTTALALTNTDDWFVKQRKDTMTKIGESETKDLCLVRVKHDHIGVGLFSVSDEYDLHLLIDELTDPDSCEYTVVTRSVGIFFSDAPIPNLHEPDDSDYKSDEEANKAAEHF